MKMTENIDEIALNVQLRKAARQANYFLGCSLYKTPVKWMQCKEIFLRKVHPKALKLIGQGC